MQSSERDVTYTLTKQSSFGFPQMRLASTKDTNICCFIIHSGYDKYVHVHGSRWNNQSTRTKKVAVGNQEEIASDEAEGGAANNNPITLLSLTTCLCWMRNSF